MNRLTSGSGAGGDKKSKSLPRSMSPAGSPVLGRPRSGVFSDDDVIIPVRDQKVMNPLFTPSPLGSPMLQRSFLQSDSQAETEGDYVAEEKEAAEEYEDIYDILPIVSEKPPALPPKRNSFSPLQTPKIPPKLNSPVLSPKRKTMSLKIRSNVSIERSQSVDVRPTISKDRPKSLNLLRHSSMGTGPSCNIPLPPPPPPLPPTPPPQAPFIKTTSPKFNSPQQPPLLPAPPPQAPQTPVIQVNLLQPPDPQSLSTGESSGDDDQFVGAMIEKSSKSGKLEKKISRRSTKRHKAAEKAEENKKLLEKDDDMSRCSTLALKDDWDEIDNMMQELHCDISQTQENIRRPSAAQIQPDKLMGEWLTKLQHQELQKLLELNGWDNINFIKDILTEEDMFVMGITNDLVRSKLLKSIERDLPEFRHRKQPIKPEDWLDDLDLSCYQDAFLSNNISTMSRVLEIWEVELTSILVIEPIGHRKRLMKSIRYLRTLQSSGTLEDHAKSKKGKESKDNAPKWSQEDLVRGVDYAVKYYGCAKLPGAENAKETALICEKQQEKIKKDQKVPEFRLRISSRGIDFIDVETQKSSCRYDTSDISFVSRDKKNLQIFSFITTDRKLHLKMCHVFKTNTRTQAYEACSTIAQSFEEAFKLRQEAKKHAIKDEK